MAKKKNNRNTQQVFKNMNGQKKPIQKVDVEKKQVQSTKVEDIQLNNEYNDKRKQMIEELEKEIESKREEMINESKKIAEKILLDSEKKIEQTLKELTEKRQKEIDDELTIKRAKLKQMEEIASENFAKSKKEIEESHELSEKLTKEIALLENEKVKYREKINEEIRVDITNLSNRIEKLHSENLELKNELNKNINEIDMLKLEKSSFIDVIGELKKTNKTKILELQIDEKDQVIDELRKISNEKQEQIKQLQNEMELYGSDPRKAIEDNSRLKKEIDDLQKRYQHALSIDEINKLQEISNEHERLSESYQKLSIENQQLQFDLRQMSLKIKDVENYSRFIKLLELQNSELKNELNRNIEKYNQKVEQVFSSLSSIDKNTTQDVFNKIPKISLEQICNQFRAYMQNRSKDPLYYDIKQVRTFIAGFVSSRITILEGLSGTGKSSLPRAFAEFIGAKTITVPVQSSWKDRNDLLGFYNDFKKQYKETEFLKALYEATINPQRIYCITLDEVNLSRIEYYFADFISVLEKTNSNEWMVDLISEQVVGEFPKAISNGKLRIGENTWFIGTANKDDSTFMITDKVYDRSVVINFTSKGKKDPKIRSDEDKTIRIGAQQFCELLNDAVDSFIDKDAYRKIIEDLDSYVRERFRITFGNRIENQLERFVPAYMACGGKLEEAIDIMFSRKVIRKLENIYDEYLKTELSDFYEYIEITYKDNFPETLDMIKKLQNR